MKVMIAYDGSADADAALDSTVTAAKEKSLRLLAGARGWAADSTFVCSRWLSPHDEISGLGGVAPALVTDAACPAGVVRPAERG